VLTAAFFVRHNMPFGATFEALVLSDALSHYRISLSVRST